MASYVIAVFSNQPSHSWESLPQNQKDQYIDIYCQQWLKKTKTERVSTKTKKAE